MHRQPGRKRDVARERETQTVARSVADPALAQEAISPVEQLGGAEAGPLSPILALIGALAFGRTRFRRNDPISNLVTPTLSDLQDPAKLQQLTERFTAMYDYTYGPASGATTSLTVDWGTWSSESVCGCRSLAAEGEIPMIVAATCRRFGSAKIPSSLVTFGATR